MRVMVATAELAPVTHVGGLGEAVAGLVGALRDAGAVVDVVLPDYEPTRTALAGETRRRIAVPGWAGPASVRVGAHATAGRLHLVTVPHIERSHPYLQPNGDGWPDNDARFLAFSRAVAALARTDPPDVLHLNDWHTATVPAALTAPPPTVLTVHDEAHQGVTSGSWLRRLGPRSRHYEWWGGTNPLAGGIALADRIVAVSVNRAREIRTPQGGCGLDGALRARGDAVSGIRNGLDVARWDPSSDSLLAARFAAGDRGLVPARRANRMAVFERVGWSDDGRPLAVMVSRLTARKGVDMIVPIVPVLRHVPMRLVLLGIGEVALVRALAGLAADHADSFAFVERVDDQLAHLLFGGGDLLVVPSRFEPCGLTAMQAMRFGAIPVVTPVGGLVDAVTDVDQSPAGHGFVADSVGGVGIVSALFRAARLLADRRRHVPLVRRIMALDWSWDEPARQYLDLYARAVACAGRCA